LDFLFEWLLLGKQFETEKRRRKDAESSGGPRKDIVLTDDRHHAKAMHSKTERIKPMNRWKFRLTMLFLSTLYACAFPGGTPPELRTAATSDLSLNEVRKDPSEHKGRTVLWGGKVAQTLVKSEGTLIELVQFPLDKRLKPEDVDVSEGRFLVLENRYLDPMIFRNGRKITVVGKIQGSRTMKLDEIAYTYPLVDAETLYLWEEEPPETRIYNYPVHPYWHGHRWWWHP
jgi:outer membrane lipoprotein